jgi:hypothetical protein
MAHVNTKYNTTKSRVALALMKYGSMSSTAQSPPKPLLPPTSTILTPLHISEKIHGNFANPELSIEAELITEVMKLRAELRIIKDKIKFYES